MAQTISRLLAPAVLLAAPVMLVQGADILATARFLNPLGDGAELSELIPTDATFYVRRPNGIVTPHAKATSDLVKIVGTTLTIAVKADAFGDWYVRIEGTLLAGGAQRVRVVAEKMVTVSSSPMGR